MFTSFQDKRSRRKAQDQILLVQCMVLFLWTDGRKQGNSDISVSLNLIESTPCTKIYLLLFCPLGIDLPSGLFLFIFSTRTLFAFLISCVCYACPFHCILFDTVAFIVLGEQYKPLQSSFSFSLASSFIFEKCCRERRAPHLHCPIFQSYLNSFPDSRLKLQPRVPNVACCIKFLITFKIKATLYSVMPWVYISYYAAVYVCLQLTEQNLVIMSVGYELVAGGGRVTSSQEYERNMATFNAIGKYTWVVGNLES